MKQKGDIQVIHFGVDEKGNLQPEVLKDSAVEISAKKGSEKGTLEVSDVTFDAASFSMYGVVQSEILEETIITADGKNYEVRVAYDQSAGIPEDSKLSVEEYKYTSDEYKDAYDRVVAFKKAKDSEFSEAGMGFEALDISIIGPDGNVVEPEAPVSVTITRDGLPETIEKDQFLDTAEIQHIVETSEGTHVDAVAGADEDVAGEITVSDGSVNAEFTVDHFSTYTISWHGALAGQRIQGVTSGDYIIYAQDAYNGNYYALVPSSNTNANLTSVRLTNENGKISYSGSQDLSWHVEVSGSGDSRKETGAADGYNQLTDPTIVVSSAGTVTYNQPTYADSNKGPDLIYRDKDGEEYFYSIIRGDKSDEYAGNADYTFTGYRIVVNNSSGTELPASGGAGTTWIYLLGFILVLGCGVTLIARRRIGPAGR